MALEKIVFKLVVDDSGNAVKLKATQKGYKDIDLTVKNAEKSANELNTAISKTGSGANIKSIKITQKEYEKLARTQNQVKNASGSASSSVLELGRAISDSNYGIQGMANNLSQLSSNLLFTVKSAGGLTGGLQALKSAFMGPLGLIVGFQTVIMLIERFSMRQKEATSDVEEFKIKMEEINSILGQQESRYKDLIDLTRARTKNLEEQKDLDEQIAELEDKRINLSIKGIDARASRVLTEKLRKENLAKLEQELIDLTKAKSKSEQDYLRVRKEFIDANDKNIVGLKKIIDLYKKERDEVSDNDAYEEKTKIIESYEEKIRDITGALSDYEKALRKIRNMEADDKASALEEITQAESDYIDSLGTEYEQEVRLIESKYFRLIELAKRYGWDTSMLEKARQKEIEDIEIKGTKKTRERVNRIFKEQVLDLQNFILQQQRDTEKSKERNVMNLLKIDQRYAVEDLKLTHDTFVEKQKLRFQQWLETEASRKDMSVEEFKNSKKTKIFYEKEKAKLDKSLKDAQAQFDIASDKQKLAQEAETQRKRLEITEKFNDLILRANLKSAQAEAQARLGRYDGTNAGSLGRPQSKVGAEGVDEQIAIKEALMAEEQANFEKTLAIKLENLKNQGFLLAEREAIIAEDRFQFQTDMVTRELELEQMKVDSKRSINEQYVSWFSGLGTIFRNIAGENEALANLALVLEKGSAIAGIIIKTQSANRQLMNTATAESAELTAKGTASVATGLMLSVVDPIRGGAMVKTGNAGIASAGAIMAGAQAVKTKNNIGAGLSIAQILSTTLQSRSSGGGGGGSSSAGASGGGGRTFDFNLVGSTGENQLAQGIAGQLGNPVQAYVVSSQMTSQQQLDNAIQTSATIGD